MPANPKYLEQSNWRKFAKLFAGIFVGYFMSALLHLSLAILFAPYHKEFLITTIYTFYVVWVVLMLLPYLFKNGWKVLGMYLLITLVLLAFYIYIKPNNPFYNE